MEIKENSFPGLLMANAEGAQQKFLALILWVLRPPHCTAPGQCLHCALSCALGGAIHGE